MKTDALRDWATENGSDVEVGADRTLGLTSKLIRFRRNGVPTIAVGSDADAKTRIDAVLDTTEPEVLPAVSPLYDLPNVLLTPHIAGALAGERDRMVDLALGEIERFVRGESLEHEVRLEDWDQLA